MMTMLERRWMYGAALACVFLSAIYPLVLPTPLLDPDEALHAVIAQEMVETSDYLTPRLRGTIFRDKPILYFFAQAISLRLFGMNESAVRLPGFLFTLLGVATTWLLAHRLFGDIVGRFALLISLTMAVPMAIAQAGIHDIALVPWTNVMLLGLWELDQTRTSRTHNLQWFTVVVCCALAILTKGLIGVAVVSVGYGGYLLLTRQRVISGGLRLVTIIIAGSLLASPWFLHIEALDPGYLRYYFFDRHVMGFATATQRHGDEPWFYYLPVLFGGSMPWLLYVVTGVGNGSCRMASGHPTRRPLLFVLCWLVGGLLFLSIAKSKLATYALPLFPAVAILAGLGWQQYLAGRLTPWQRRLFSWSLNSTGFLGIVLPIAAVTFVASASTLPVPPAAWIAALILSGLSAAMVTRFRKQQVSQAISLGAVWMSLLLASIMTWPGQIVADQYSARALGLWLKEQGELPPNLVLAGGRVQSAIFYLSPQQRKGLGTDQIRRVHESETSTWTSLPENTVVAIPEDIPPNDIVQSSFAEEVSTIVVGRFRIIKQTAATIPSSKEQEAVR